MKKRANIIAERNLFAQDDNGSWRPVRITFEKPTKQRGGEWACTRHVDGLDLGNWPSTQAILGEDSVQALDLAMRLTDRALSQSKAFSQNRLSWSASGESAMRLGDSPGPMPIGGAHSHEILRSELVRTVEVELNWSLPCVLRIEVLVRRFGKKNEQELYWTRVWRSDMYRVATSSSASVRGRKRHEVDETLLVEDMMFSDSGVGERTIDAAVEATIAKIKWQLFANTDPKPPTNRSTTKKGGPKRR